MATTSTPTPAPANSAPANSKWVMILSILKYALPVAASVASIWLHNKQTVAQIGATVNAVENV